MQIVRWLILLIGLFFLMIGMGLIGDLYKISVLQPSAYLVGATFIAYSIPILWIGITHAYKPLVGGGLGMMLTFGGWGFIFFHLQEIELGKFCFYVAVLSLWIFFLGLKVPKKKQDRIPFSMQCLFALLLTFSLLEGLYLLVPLPGHFAWILSAELSVIYGWILIGCSIFLGWGLLQPIWENGYPLLYGVIVYDVLLVGPFISLLKGVHQVDVIPVYLWMILITLFGSGIWALFELLTRFFTIRKS